MMMDRRLAEWFASDDTGTSSEAIALWLSAGVVSKGWGPSTPSDPSDLGRCLRLLERIPEWKARIPKMAGAGGQWPALLARWDEIVATFIEEAGGAIPDKGASWSAPKTYALMKQAEGRVA